jgi:hypothetical protein
MQQLQLLVLQHMLLLLFTVVDLYLHLLLLQLLLLLLLLLLPLLPLLPLPLPLLLCKREEGRQSHALPSRLASIPVGIVMEERRPPRRRTLRGDRSGTVQLRRVDRKVQKGRQVEGMQRRHRVGGGHQAEVMLDGAPRGILRGGSGGR